jgi:TonB family protein
MKNAIKLLMILLLLHGVSKSQTDSNGVAKPSVPNVYTYVEQMPTFPAGQEAMMQYLSSNIRYPKDAQENNIQGRVVVQFVVNEDGKIRDVKVLRGVGGGLDQEAMRVVKEMPNWIPGKQNGKPVAVQYTLPVQFQLKEDTDSKPLTNPDGSIVYNKVAVKPEFSGGMDGLQKYLQDNLKYPESARANNVEGKVYVSFIVNEKGKIKDVKILKGLNKACDKEAMRVVKKMPRWTPGQQDGKNVKVIYTLPVNFKLQ